MKISAIYKVTFLLILLSYIKADVKAQTRFQKSFGGPGNDAALCVIQTSDTGYLLCGYTTSFGSGSKDVYVIKLDSMGIEKWSKTFGGNFDDEGTYCIEDNGTYVIGGYTKSYGAGGADGFLGRLDTAGNMLWFKTFGTTAEDSHLLRFRKTMDNGFIITYPYKYGGFSSYTIIKTDGNGTLQWQRTYGGTQANTSGDIVQFPDSGFLISGTTLAYGQGLSDLLIMRIDKLGNTIWTKTLGSALNDGGGYSITRISNSEAVITGKVDNAQFGLSDFVALKIDYLTSAVSWAMEYGKQGKAFQAYSAVLTLDNGLAFAINDYNSQDLDMRILKIDTSGNIQWQKKYGGFVYDVAFGICNTQDNGFALAGYTTSFGAGGTDMYLVKTDSLGRTECNQSDDTIQQGLFYSIETLPTIPQVFPNDVYTSPSLLTSTTMNEIIADVCFLTPPPNCTCQSLGPELVYNGDFTLGNTGFTTSYTYDNSGASWPGLYGITYDGHSGNTCCWCHGADHTTGTGKFMWADASDASAINVWSQFIPAVQRNTNYIFSCWCNTLDPNGPATLRFSINGQPIGQHFTLPNTLCNWVEFCAQWNSGADTTATISITNQSIFFNGNDLGLDDISFRECANALTSSFLSSDTVFCGEGGRCLNFFDHSAGIPTSWHWFFPGASPDTSSQQNPAGICYYNTGTYPVTLIVSDSLHSDTITVSPMIFYQPTPNPPVITSSGDTVICPPTAGYSYHWYLNGNPIAGATDSSYVATTPGTYSVRVTDSLGCSALSNGLYVLITSARSYWSSGGIHIFPNPVSNRLTFYDLPAIPEGGSLEIYDVFGQKVYSHSLRITGQKSESIIDVSHLSKGIYFVQITIGDNGEKLIGKFVKE